MTELTPPQILSHVEGSDLFQELMQLPDAARLRQAFQQARAWELAPGESLPGRGERKGAYVTLSGIVTAETSVAAAAAPDASGMPEEGVAARRIFGQWTGLTGQPLETPLTAVDSAVVMECSPDLLRLLLGGVASLFQVEFYRPFLEELMPIADAPADTLDKISRTSKFRLFANGEPIVRAGEFGSTMFFVLAGVAAVQLDGGREAALPRHEFFGEMAILTYQPRSATVKAQGSCLVLECGRDSVAELRKKSKVFKVMIEENYRKRAMLSQLQSTSFFRDLEAPELEAVRDIASLETFEPYEPVFYQGDEADAVYIVLNGTMCVVQSTPDGPIPIAWVRSGEVVGEMALLPHISGTDRRRQTVTALQRVDAIQIPVGEFQEIMSRYPSVCQKLETTAKRRREMNASVAPQSSRTETLGWMMETQHIAGNAVLAVDMGDCIRCNNCVTACETVHDDGLSRFFWGNMRQEEDVMPSVRFSNSCQHCEFALCMRVCPTHAIERETDNGAVYIDYDKCIRCGKCADPSQGCPYGSIHVVPADSVSQEASLPLWKQLLRMFRKPAAGAPASDAKSGKNYPVKCDLCHGRGYQACVDHCPTGAVFRVDGDQQFADVLRKMEAKGESQSHHAQSEPLRLFVRAEFAHPPIAGKPAELEVTVRSEGPGMPLVCRRPERGVTSFKLNMYLDAPETLRVGGGGVVRQLVLATNDPVNQAVYPVTHRTPGVTPLVLSVYQGGMYLGHLPFDAEFVKA